MGGWSSGVPEDAAVGAEVWRSIGPEPPNRAAELLLLVLVNAAPDSELKEDEVGKPWLFWLCCCWVKLLLL